MKSKKREKSLVKELDAIRSLKNESIDLRELEDKMVKLIEKAAQFYQDQLDNNMAQFYFEYGSILVQILEQSQDSVENSLNCVEISRNDRELKNTQLAFENLEAAKTIIRNRLDKQNIEMYKLQDQLQCNSIQILIEIRSKINETELEMSLILIRIGDLQTWREDYKDGLLNFNAALDILKNSYNYKELSAVHFKIGNAILLQNENGCEKLSLNHLEQSFRYCYQQIYNRECDLDLKEKNLSKVVLDNDLLKMLLEKMEDTYIQLNEVNACQKEIEKWKSSEPILQQEIQYLGKISRQSNAINGIQIKRKI
ncbi:unnamed protein product (macronuclear) [Paramecium tetraurelia]|uniref:Uncharacterized protein n=1 Tax=Paramecium tetraurelia TaxID=5888 RepID=A0BLY6_PARTE|nr:uncharacterized protein GSPATT00030187001 [Paramecium tetraurelia]CAK59553.1 unnamed protein product [Paramecium tetraurelia]|eukprot:XP_001426951.1 hypothetical protein (macronuclear) [Paramecium tetraurelia strain d4-2]